jgi:SH3 domain-containing YSC84-like protein 1
MDKLRLGLHPDSAKLQSMNSILPALLLLITLLASPLYALVTVPQRVDAAVQIVQSIQNSSTPIPAAAWDKCKGVAIIKVTKAGFVVGGQGGQGIVLRKIQKPWGPGWSAPCAFSLSGGSFGAQIGGQTQQIIFLLNTDGAIDTFTGEGKAQWEAMAGGTGGHESAGHEATSWQDLPIAIYRANTGAYGGATFGGTTVNADRTANRAAYGPDLTTQDILSGKAKPPKGAERLTDLLSGKK